MTKKYEVPQEFPCQGCGADGDPADGWCCGACSAAGGTTHLPEEAIS